MLYKTQKPLFPNWEQKKHRRKNVKGALWDLLTYILLQKLFEKSCICEAQLQKLEAHSSNIKSIVLFFSTIIEKFWYSFSELESCLLNFKTVNFCSS